jgi:TPP-dependent pyruvate/acetoin dehydrogenase alpha subunit
MQISSFTPYFGPSPAQTPSSTGASNAASGTGATTSSSNSPTDGLTSKADDVVQQFMDYAKMSPMERMRAQILKSMGLTEDDLKKMSPEQQKAVEQKIEQMIKQQLQKNAGQTGQVVDVSA